MLSSKRLMFALLFTGYGMLHDVRKSSIFIHRNAMLTAMCTPDGNFLPYYNFPELPFKN